jgi:hypothetical protein
LYRCSINGSIASAARFFDEKSKIEKVDFLGKRAGKGYGVRTSKNARKFETKDRKSTFLVLFPFRESFLFEPRVRLRRLIRLDRSERFDETFVPFRFDFRSVPSRFSTRKKKPIENSNRCTFVRTANSERIKSNEESKNRLSRFISFLGKFPFWAEGVAPSAYLSGPSTTYRQASFRFVPSRFSFRFDFRSVTFRFSTRKKKPGESGNRFAFARTANVKRTKSNGESKISFCRFISFLRKFPFWVEGVAPSAYLSGPSASRRQASFRSVSIFVPVRKSKHRRVKRNLGTVQSKRLCENRGP